MGMQYELRYGLVSPDRDVYQGGQIIDVGCDPHAAAMCKAVGVDSRTVHSA